jgi:hypothetical protein
MPEPGPHTVSERSSESAESAESAQALAAGGEAPRGIIERSEAGGGDPDGFAGGAGGEAPRGIDRKRALIYAALLGLAVMWLTGAIPRWGQWYSEQPIYRAQAHALLAGRFALSHDPAGLGLDLAWIDGGVQQVWGLGVPLWLALWEAIGRVIRLTPFPDRLAMLFGVVAMMYVLVRAWLGPGGERSHASRGALLFTALLPGVLTMLRGRVAVYEEAEAYAYGAAMLLLGGVIMMVRRPSTVRYVLLLAFAGATGLIRPTVWFYGAAAAVIATALYIRHRGAVRASLGAVALAWGLFLAGGAALYASNAARFGAGGEFGHRVNLGALYVTRFANPYEAVPAWTAARELAGGMFTRPELSAHRGFYDAGIHAGQASTPRWREYYFTTYTWPYAPLLLAGLALGVVAWWPARRIAPGRTGTGDPRWRETRWLVAWAVLGGAPLVVFYLHSPSISSRYYLDLGPAIAVLIVTAWRHAAAALGRGWLGGLAFAGWVLFWLVSMRGARVDRGYLAPVGMTAAVASMNRVLDPPATGWQIPDAYDLADPWLPGSLGERWWCRCWLDPAGAQACDHTGLAPGDGVERVPGDRPRLIEAARETCPPEVDAWLAPPALWGNGPDWDTATGAVAAATYLFVDDPAYVEVEVGPAGPGFAPAVRARIQREELALVAAASTARGARLVFAGPRTARYRHGVQLLFLAFGPPDRIDRPTSGYSLLRVAWRDHREPP